MFLVSIFFGGGIKEIWCLVHFDILSI